MSVSRTLGTSSTLGPALALIGVTAIWGSTFVVIKDMTESIPVTDFLAVRFAIASVGLFLLAPRTVGRLSPDLRRKGVVLGMAFGAGQLLQTWGLTMVSASVSGFITGLYVVLTPLLAAWLFKASISRATWLAVALATAGLAVLSLQGFAIGAGEVLTALSALGYALHIVLLGAWSKPGQSVGLAIVQMGTIAAICGVAALPGGIQTPSTATDWLVMLYVALAAGGVALLVQTWAQTRLPATRAAIIMISEPVFAALFGIMLHGDAVTARFLLGAGLMLSAMYIAELGPRRSRDATVPRLPGE